MTPSKLVFRPRPSRGWVWLVALALLVLLPTLGLSLALIGEEHWAPLAINAAVGLVIGLPILVVAFWFPTMRYELDANSLTLRYGPVLRYEISLEDIQRIRRRDLSITLWSSLRVPGLALFGVPYADVGTVRMCATAAAKGILLIETSRTTYGISPEDEEGLVSALRERMGFADRPQARQASSTRDEEGG